jgi:hypothetical protein
MWYYEDCTKGINHIVILFIYFVFDVIIFKTTTINNK